MVEVSVERVIPAPRDAVAAFAADPANAPLWYVNIRSADWVGEPGVAVGHRAAFTAEFLGRRLSYTYEIAEHEPGRKLVMRTAEGPFPMTTIYEWEDAAAGTLMRLTNRGAPSGFKAVFAPVMRLAMRRAMTKDLQALARRFA